MSDKPNKPDNQLKPCPCGKVPTALNVFEGDCKWYQASGNCCGEWLIEFRSHYRKVDSPEAYQLAVEAWNKAARKEQA